MDVENFYDDISNCIQAIVYKFGTPDSVEKYKSKINFYYNKTTESKVKVELFFKDKMYIVNTNDKKYSFNIKETEYYQNIRRETMKLDMKSLDVAIREFNEWDRSARIYLDTSDGMFETSVYANDMQMEAQSSTKNYVCVFYKDEFQQKHIGDKRKKYITKYSELILDGWSGMQADYHLSDMGIFG